MPTSFAARGPMVIPAPSGYAGPGDAVPGASFFTGLQAYNAAYGLGNAVDIFDSGGLNPLTVKFLSTGFIDTPAITTWSGTHGTPFVTTSYDQISTANAVQPVVADAPTLILAGFGSLPTIRFTHANTTRLTVTLVGAISQPYTVVLVTKRTGNFTSVLEYVANGNFQVSGESLVNKAYTVAGTSHLVATATDSQMNSLIAVFDDSGSGSSLYVGGSNASDTGGPPGTNSTGISFDWGGSGAFTCDADQQILGIWPFAFTGAQVTAMQNNLHTNWGV